ncbi:EamA family transporter [Candidatus Woesearchaeota archaeon]|nr:EamA family transporter [Candidatus Woesearchaeota archaeon]
MKTYWWAVALMFFCTLLTSSAQLLYKLGSKNLQLNLSLLQNYYLIAGLGLYVIGAGIFVLALRGGEVSVLYPIIATSYVWVTLLSIYFLMEQLNISKIFGVGAIILGIIIIGVGSRDAAPEVL